MSANRWLLPDGIDEVLPERAAQVELLRRQLLDLYHRWGYDLVIPPLVEFADSLLSGTGADLDLMTFRITDQLSGRMLGVRADITPQAVRMDAHSLRREGPSRLCYAGTVLHTRPRRPLQSRAPISIGVELFGESSVAADIEVIELFLATLVDVGVATPCLDIGHVDILRGLLADSGLAPAQRDELFELMQRKASGEIDAFISREVANGALAQQLRALPTLIGGSEVLQRAEQQLAGAPPAVLAALAQLRAVVDALLPSGINIHIDLSESPGFHYHTGVVFAAYLPGHGKAIGNGGRYDAIGAQFGRPRPATGFAFDLKELAGAAAVVANRGTGIFVAHAEQPDRRLQIEQLRASGERVVEGFAGQRVDFAELRCDRQLCWRDGSWQLQRV